MEKVARPAAELEFNSWLDFKRVKESKRVENQQFGEQITAVVNETLSILNVTQGQIIVEDKGALDCVIRARMQAAILRGTASNEIAWEKL